MNEIDFEYSCPSCEEAFCGSMPIDSTEYVEMVTCEDCGHKYRLIVKLDITVDIDVTTTQKQ